MDSVLSWRSHILSWTVTWELGYRVCRWQKDLDRWETHLLFEVRQQRQPVGTLDGGQAVVCGHIHPSATVYSRCLLWSNCLQDCWMKPRGEADRGFTDRTQISVVSFHNSRYSGADEDLERLQQTSWIQPPCRPPETPF